jgi:hypothetical protein
MIKVDATTTKGFGRYTKVTGDLHETTCFTDRQLFKLQGIHTRLDSRAYTGCHGPRFIQAGLGVTPADNPASNNKTAVASKFLRASFICAPIQQEPRV